MAGEWRQHQVSQLLEEGRLVIGDGYRAKNDELSSRGLPFARAGNINDGFHFDDADHFPEVNLSRVGNKISQPGDVVFTSKGTVGRFAFVRTRTPRFVYSPQLCFWRSVDRQAIDARFLYYWMFGREFFVQFKGVAGQTDMAEYVSLTDQRRMHITLPPLSEQRAIAHILGTLDDKIELNRRMNETLEAMARALFKSWFVDFDPVRRNMARKGRGQLSPAASRHPLPVGEGRGENVGKAPPPSPTGRRAGDEGVVEGTGFDHLFQDPFEDSELGEIPNGWEVRSLYETAEFINGAAFRSEDFCDSSRGLPVVKIAELKDGISAQTKFSKRVFDPRQLIDTGELLYSWSGSPDTSLDAFLWTKGRGLLNQHIFKVVTPTIAEKRFVYYLLKFLRSTLVEIARNKQTTGLGHVTIADMKRLYVCSPDLKVLAAFDHQVAPLFDKSFQNTLESQTLTALRDALLPKLISSELRTRTSDEFAQEITS